MSDTVAVFFGGDSNEREISVITGMLAVNLLRGTAHRVLPVYLPLGGGMVTGAFRGPADFKRGANTKFVPVRLEEGKLRVGKRKTVKIDAALNCCHGGMGEDGTLAALLRYYRIPSASPEAPMSAICMDKILTKYFVKGMEIPVVRSFSVRETEWKDRDAVLQSAARFGYPLIVKPARLGSSIGVKVARDGAQLSAALDLAFRLDSAALIEAYLPEKRDINCAAYRRGEEIVLSPLEEVLSAEDILTFSEKYEQPGANRSVIPAPIPEETAQTIRSITSRLYEALGGQGVVRADFLIAGDEVYLNELNTVPGSLALYLFSNSLTGGRALLCSLLAEAKREAKKEVVCSGILEGDVFSHRKGGKRI